MKQNAMYLLKGLFLSALLFSLMVLLLALLMQKAQWGDSVLLPLLVVTFCLSSFLGSLYFSKHADKRRFLWGTGFGIAFFALYLILAFCLTPATDMDSNRVLTFLASALASGCLGGMLS